MLLRSGYGFRTSRDQANDETLGPAASGQDPDRLFQRLLEDLCNRTGMYVGRPSVRAAAEFLDGYCHALEDLGLENRPLAGWQRWIESKFLIFSPAYHRSPIVVHAYATDEEALKVLPSLFGDYLRDRAEVGIEGIERELERRMVEAHGERWIVQWS